MVIIGAGKAAASAIVSLREHKWTGSITLIGEEQHAPYDRPRFPNRQSQAKKSQNRSSFSTRGS